MVSSYMLKDGSLLQVDCDPLGQTGSGHSDIRLVASSLWAYNLVDHTLFSHGIVASAGAVLHDEICRFLVLIVNI